MKTPPYDVLIEGEIVTVLQEDVDAAKKFMDAVEAKGPDNSRWDGPSIYLYKMYLRPVTPTHCAWRRLHPPMRNPFGPPKK